MVRITEHDGSYGVYYSGVNGEVCIGEIMCADDGEYVFMLNGGSSFFRSWVLSAISNKLQELNVERE